MKKILILLTGVLIFVLNTAFGDECKQIHHHDTHNVGHQFYDALIETPKDALVKGAVATKDLTKAVAATVVFSNAAHELKDAAKELVIDTPVKTAKALKNGTIKAYDATKDGAKIVYKNAVVKPARAIKYAAQEVAEGTKETMIEVGEEVKEVSHDIWDATKSGVKKVYHVFIEKPVGAVRAAGHYLVHGDEDEITHHHDHHHDHEVSRSDFVPSFIAEKYIVIDEEPIFLTSEMVGSAGIPQSDYTPTITTVSVMSGQLAEDIFSEEPNVSLECLVNVERANSTIALSEQSLRLLSQAYDSVTYDLSCKK